jgi:hypothetical protein
MALLFYFIFHSLFAGDARVNLANRKAGYRISGRILTPH